MIKIYKVSDYKKSGGLKKTAKGLFFNNTDEYGKEDKYTRLAKMIKEEGYMAFESPYIFTYIKAQHREYGAVTILQHINLGGRELTTSPIKLLEALKQ